MARDRLEAKQRLMRFVVILLCTATLLIICLGVIGHGYFPPDDALRHVAKVESGKEWHDILVIREEIRTDSHPGWHVVLGAFQQLTGASRTALLNFSVISLFLAFVLPPALLFPRPEAWIFSLTTSALFSTGALLRLFKGRPFILSMALVMVFCFLWGRVRDRKRPYGELLLFMAITALATWIHGAWYLLALPLAALLFARQWRVFALMGTSAAAGILLGGLFTNEPILFLHQMIFHAIEAFGNHDFERQLVTEFQPFDGAPTMVLFIAVLLLWRKSRGDWKWGSVDNPVFILVVTGWVLGFWASRFWTDWGWPATAFWVAAEIQGVLGKDQPAVRVKRLGVASLLCLILFLAVTNDGGSRWSSGAEGKWPDMRIAEQRPWLPEKNGIVYTDDMRVFYQVFFNNPHGSWRYILGFEPVWMPRADLEIYRKIQLSRGRYDSYLPWVEKMTEKDRMILVRVTMPTIKELEWHETTRGVWIGKRFR